MMKELNGRTIEHLGFSEIYGIPAFRTVGINLTIGGLGRAIGNRQLAMPRLSQFGPPHASRDRFCTTMGSRKASYQVIKLQQVREPNRLANHSNNQSYAAVSHPFEWRVSKAMPICRGEKRLLRSFQA